MSIASLLRRWPVLALCPLSVACANTTEPDGAESGAGALEQAGHALTPADTIAVDPQDGSISCNFESGDLQAVNDFRRMVGILGQPGVDSRSANLGFSDDLGVFFVKAPIGTKVLSDSLFSSDGTELTSPNGFQIAKTNSAKYAAVTGHTGVASVQFEIPVAGGSTRTVEKTMVFMASCTCAVDVAPLK